MRKEQERLRQQRESRQHSAWVNMEAKAEQLIQSQKERNEQLEIEAEQREAQIKAYQEQQEKKRAADERRRQELAAQLATKREQEEARLAKEEEQRQAAADPMFIRTADGKFIRRRIEHDPGKVMGATKTHMQTAETEADLRSEKQLIETGLELGQLSLDHVAGHVVARDTTTGSIVYPAVEQHGFAVPEPVEEFADSYTPMGSGLPGASDLATVHAQRQTLGDSNRKSIAIENKAAAFLASLGK